MEVAEGGEEADTGRGLEALLEEVVGEGEFAGEEGAIKQVGIGGGQEAVDLRGESAWASSFTARLQPAVSTMAPTANRTKYFVLIADFFR